jgi:DNA polymerase III subunit epsilon
MYLFFDTETTGLPRSWRAPVTDLNNWPRMVQLAWLLHDASGAVVESGSAIIKPEGYAIPADAARIHRITTERALREGVGLEDALRDFAAAMERATLLVAHNLSFDEMIVGAEFLRKQVPSRLDAMPRFCTMKSTSEVCRIPSQYGFKWPKLEELHQFLFNRTFVDTHDASADVQACATCFFELTRRGLVTLPGI